MTVETVRLEEVCEQITDGTHYTPPSEPEGVPFLTVKDMGENGLDLVGCARISQSEFDRAAKGGSVPKRGDVLFSKDGTVGKVHVVEKGESYGLLSSIAIVRPLQQKLDSCYLAKILGSPRTLQQAAQMRTGSALRRLILKDLKRIKIPIPPLPEQHRIVEKIDELFSDLDTGVASLQRAKANLKRYRASVLKSAVEGRLTEEWRKDHPQTEDGQMRARLRGCAGHKIVPALRTLPAGPVQW